MTEALEGSQAIARTVAACKPQVVAAYPITPQTHIVENISKLVADGKFNCEYISVESEFSAASVVLGAAAAGSRAYTATASQGILLMSEVLYDIAGLRIPLVLTCANRAVSAPISIWNDHQDSMAVRDAGWIQLYCADNQEAVDTTVQAFRIAEQLEIPVMVCVDGFTLTHTLEPIDLPSQEVVDQFLPPFKFSRPLNTASPISVGTLVSPDYYTEVRYQHQQAMRGALAVIEQCREEWRALIGRDSGGLLEIHDDADAKIGLLVIGSVTGTFLEARELFTDLPATRLIRLRSFRPFPVTALQQACTGLETLIVVERAFSPGGGGIVGNETKAALSDAKNNTLNIINVAMGLGGRDMTLDTYRLLIEKVVNGELQPGFSIFDVDPNKLAPTA